MLSIGARLRVLGVGMVWNHATIRVVYLAFVLVFLPSLVCCCKGVLDALFAETGSRVFWYSVTHRRFLSMCLSE
jgi:hypothetical protein